MKKYSLLPLLLLWQLCAYASVRQWIDGVYYELDTERITATVAKPGEAVYSGKIVIPAQVPYRGRLYEVNNNIPATAVNNSDITELHFGEGFKNISLTSAKDMRSLKSIHLPSTLEPNFTGSHRISVMRCENAISVYVIDEGDTYRIKVDKFNIYDNTGKKVEPYIYDDITDKRYYADANGFIGPLEKKYDNYAGGNMGVILQIGSYNVVMLCCDINGKMIVLRENVAHVATGNKLYSGGMRFDVTSDHEVCVARDVNITATGDVVIPSKVSGNGKTYDVTTVAEWAFIGSDITSVTIPASVKYLCGYRYFQSSQSSRFDEVQSCEAFANCLKLTKVQFNEGLIGIGGYSFSNCTALKEVSLPLSLQYIGTGAFSRCSGLEKVVLRSNLKKIARSSFDDCPSLKAVFITSVRPPEADDAFGDETYRRSVLYVPTGTKDIYACHPSWSKFRYIREFDPDNIDKINIHEVDNYNVTLNGIKYRCHVDNHTAEVTGFTDDIPVYVQLPSQLYLPYDKSYYNVTAIDNYAFVNCEKLEGINTGSVTEIREGAFSGNVYKQKLYNVELPEVRTIGAYAFAGKEELERVIMPKVKDIDMYAFNGCTGIREMQSQSVENIDSYAFANCRGINPDMPLLQTVGNSAFKGSSFSHPSGIINLIFPNVRSVDRSAFANIRDRIRSVVMPRVTEMASNAFEGVTNIEKLLLRDISNLNYTYPGFTPNNVINNVTTIYLATDEVPVIWNYGNYDGYLDPFAEETYSNTTLMVPRGSADKYRADLHKNSDGKLYGWGRFKNIDDSFTAEEMLAGIAELPEQPKLTVNGIIYRLNDDLTATATGMAREDITDLVIPATVTYNNMQYAVTEVTDWAFAGKRITSVTMNSVLSIGEYSFSSYLLKSVTAESLTTIGPSAFDGTALTEVSFDNVKSVGKHAFRNCGELKKIKLNHATTIGLNALACWPDVIELNNVKYLDEGALPYKGISLYVMGRIPPYLCELDESRYQHLFNESVLYVPWGCAEAYRNDPEWGKFKTIRESDPAGVENVTYPADAMPVGYYDINGVRHDRPQRGFNIEISSDGSTRKIIVKD